MLRSPGRCGKRYLERVFHLSPPTLPIKQRKGRPRAAQRTSLRLRRTFEPATIPRLPPHLHVVQYLYVLYSYVCGYKYTDTTGQRGRGPLSRMSGTLGRW